MSSDIVPVILHILWYFQHCTGSWKDDFPYEAASDHVFKDSGCSYTSKPARAVKGPFCASTCVDGSWKSGGGFSSSPVASVAVAFDPEVPESPVVWVTREDYKIYHRTGVSGGWTRVSGSLKQVSIAFQGVALRTFGVNNGDHVFYAYNYGDFGDQPGYLDQISIGCNPTSDVYDCEIWGVNSNQLIFEKVSTHGAIDWDKISGTLVQVSVAYNSEGSVIWGVQDGGKVFYRFGINGSWNEVSASPEMKQVSVAYDMEGESFLVYGVDSSGWVYYRRSFDRNILWKRAFGIELSYVSVAFDAYGRPMIWGVGEGGGTMYRWHDDNDSTFAAQWGDAEMNQRLILRVSLVYDMCVRTWNDYCVLILMCSCPHVLLLRQDYPQGNVDGDDSVNNSQVQYGTKVNFDSPLSLVSQLHHTHNVYKYYFEWDVHLFIFDLEL